MPQVGFPDLHRQVVFGESHGKIIWQPRIKCWYYDKKFAREPLPEPYEGMTLPEVYRSLECSARIYHYNESFKRIEHPSVRFECKNLGSDQQQVTITTPVGKQVEVTRKTASSTRRIHVKWPVETEEELKVAAWREENAAWQWDQEAFDKVAKEWGDLGAPTAYLPRMNVQNLYLNQMGAERAIYAIHDWPHTVEAFFRALEASHDRLIEIVNASPIDIINFGENVHAGTLPPSLFRKYHLPACRRRCEKLHTARKFCHAHWDGDVKPLLPFARDTGLDGIEAITPQPQGDVTLEEVKYALGDEMFLIDGLPAILFDETFPVTMLEDYTHRLIDLFAPKLVLGISDELSSTGDIERVRLVGRIVNEYNRQLGELGDLRVSQGKHHSESAAMLPRDERIYTQDKSPGRTKS